MQLDGEWTLVCWPGSQALSCDAGKGHPKFSQMGILAAAYFVEGSSAQDATRASEVLDAGGPGPL